MSVDNGYSDHEKSNIEENLTQLQGNSADQDNLDLEIKQEKAIHTNEVFIPSSIMMIDHHPNEYGTLHYLYRGTLHYLNIGPDTAGALFVHISYRSLVFTTSNSLFDMMPFSFKKLGS